MFPSCDKNVSRHLTTPRVKNLLCNIVESLLANRLDPCSVVDGFSVDIGAFGSFQPPHLRLPTKIYFYSLTTDNDDEFPFLVILSIKMLQVVLKYFSG